IPQISYASTSPELSDNNRFDYFLPGEGDGAIVRSMGWNYVTAIYDEGTYESAASRSSKVMPAQQGEGLAGIADGLLKLEKSRVVVAFCQGRDPAAPIWPAGSRLTKRSFFWWPATAGDERLNTLLGSSFLQRGPSACCRRGGCGRFRDQYFRQPDPRFTPQVNPWCRSSGRATFTATGTAAGSGLNNCTGAEQIGLHSRYEQEGLVPMLTPCTPWLHSLENILHRLCPSVHPKSCRDIIQKLNGTVLRAITFATRRESLYEIFQFQRRPVGKNASSVFEYVKIGTWGDDHLNWNNSSLRWGTPDEVAPRSVCSELCGFGYRTVAPNKEAATCCWECIVLNATLCSNCELGSVPNRFFNECQPVPVETIQLGSVWALLPMTFQLPGTGLDSLCPGGLFVRYNNTPIIRASGRELCYVMLAGVSMSYCMTFIMLAPPTRKYSAENFNEAKYIAFTMYSTCIVWLAFIAIYFGSLRNFRSKMQERNACKHDDLLSNKRMTKMPNHLLPEQIKLTSLCMCISISALGHCWLHVRPKIYIVLFKPHKNVRRSNASPAAGSGGAQGRRELFSPTIKAAAAGQWSSESQRSGRQHRYGGGREAPPSASALPADGGVASDSDSDSGGGGGNIKGPGFS
uniref:G_PROTEIN_RECEP_F3_4 domain-containing protein n=1 Tax=Macrostomum lignano TaxID=282301 RepID=A0A1I8JQ87_9PLAT